MIAKNEIEARMRWTHGSRQAEKVGRASPPNISLGRGGGVGPWGIPAGLSAGDRRCAIRLQSLTPRGVHVLSVGACLYRLFLLPG